MQAHIAVLSQDEVFSRMIELEFVLHQLDVCVLRDHESHFSADIVLLDLDTVSAPVHAQYHQMIGFTRSSALSSDDARRQCAMILHRPFEMNILRREVFDILRQHNSMESHFHALAVDLDSDQRSAKSELFLKDGALYYGTQQILLSKRELQTVSLLMEKQGKVATREEISCVIGESGANKVEVYICYLRKKLEKICAKRVIATVRGKGYRLLI